MPSTLRSTDCSNSSFGQLRLPEEIGLESHVCNLLSVSRGSRKLLDLAWTHDALSVTFGPFRGVRCLANNSLFSLSLTTLTTHSFGTVWLHLVQVSNELIFFFSWFLDICNYFGFVYIAVERVKRSEEDCLPSFFTFLSSCHQSRFCFWVLISCSTHVMNKLFPSVRNHHVIHHMINPPEWPPGSHEYISNLHFHLHRFQTSSWSFQDKSNGANPRLWILFPFDFGIFRSIPGSIRFQCIAPSVSRSSWSWCRTFLWHTWRCEFQKQSLLHFLHPGNVVEILSYLGTLHVNGLCSRMYWHRIAAAAAAAFRGGWGYPHRGGNGFQKHARRFILRFNIVGILWTLLVIHHGRFGRFETHIIEVFFRAQRGIVIHNVRVVTMNFVKNLSRPRLFKIHTESDGTCTSIPGTSITVAIPMFTTGPISCSASIDAFWLWILSFSGCCVFFAHWRAFSHPSSSWVFLIKWFPFSTGW